MNDRLTLHMVVGGTLMAAALAVFAAAPADSAHFSSSGQVSQDPDPMVGGTIPWGPPGVPQMEQAAPGPQGPVRTDTGLASDPSIRDTDPLTMNGPWEQLPGDRVVNRAVQQQQAQQPQQPQ